MYGTKEILGTTINYAPGLYITIVYLANDIKIALKKKKEHFGPHAFKLVQSCSCGTKAFP